MPGVTRDRVPAADHREARVRAQAEARTVEVQARAVQDRGRTRDRVGKVRTTPAPARIIQDPDQAVRMMEARGTPALVQKILAVPRMMMDPMQHPRVPEGWSVSIREDGGSASVTAVTKSSIRRAVPSSTGRQSPPMRSASTKVALAKPFQGCDRASRSNRAASVRLRTCSFCRMLVM